MIDNTYYIYKIVNKINGKLYIGKTKNMRSRWNKHKLLMSKNVNRVIYDAMNKYGIDNFEMIPIENCSEDIVNSREIYWISQYNTCNRDYGYNMTIGGEGGNTWERNQHQEETSRKLSLKNTGKKRDEKFKERMREISLTREPMSIETKSKISKALKEKYISGELSPPMWMVESSQKGERHPMYGKHHTDIAKNKISLARTGKTYDDIFDTDTSNNLRELHRDMWSGTNNPNFIYVDPDYLLSLLDEGYLNFELAELLNISKATVISKVKKVTGLTPGEYRKQRGYLK